jgi:hypothetical protein
MPGGGPPDASRRVSHFQAEKRTKIVTLIGIKLITGVRKPHSHANLWCMLMNRKHEIFAREIAAGGGRGARGQLSDRRL